MVTMVSWEAPSAAAAPLTWEEFVGWWLLQLNGPKLEQLHCKPDVSPASSGRSTAKAIPLCVKQTPAAQQITCPLWSLL